MDGNTNFSAGNTFDRLVSDLSLEERQNLLNKLKGQSNLSAEPLYEIDETEDSKEIAEITYTQLPWYYRLYYFILSIFKGIAPAKIYEDKKYLQAGREIDAIAPGLYDCQRNFLLADFCKLLTSLKDSARFFHSSLEKSVNYDKGNFYAFLGSLEMADVHSLLLNGTDPDKIAAEIPEATGQDVKQRIYKNMEDAFAAINEEQRNAMYFNARSLHCLKELSSFVFDRVIMAFGAVGPSQTCPANVIKDLLGNLNNILYSLNIPPTMALFQSLFIFSLQDKYGDTEFNIGQEMRLLLNKAENALENIRNFNKQVPLTRILRCIHRNLRISPQQISGGEDWFSVYRDYWKRQIDGKYSEYMQIRKHNELSNSFRYFLKGTNFKSIENVVSETRPDGIPVPEAFTLSFLLSFHSAVFMAEINNNLRPILIDGEFFKKENRTEFTEAYNDLMKIEDDIRHFEMQISSTGDFGKRYSAAKQELLSLPIKRRKIQIVIDDASQMASAIINRTRAALKMLVNVLNGIIKKDSSGRFEGLANMAQLTNKNHTLVNGINDAIQTFQQALQLLDDIAAINSQH